MLPLMNEHATTFDRPIDPTPLHTVARHGRLWGRFLAQAIARESQFRAQFSATAGVGLIQLVLALIPVWLLFDYTTTINGWTGAAVLSLVGLYQVVSGLLAAFVAPNMQRLSTAIRQGDLDLILIRPVSSQFYVSLRWMQPAELFNVVTGLAVLLIGLSHTGGTATAAGVVQAVVLAACGIILLTCFWSLLAFTAFWLISVESISLLFNDLWRAGQYPVTFYPTVVRALLTFILPVAFATTLPVRALTGHGSWPVVLGALALAVAALLLARAVWRFGLRSYSSASS
jgi:ABC-2 type transport system permease protein